MGWIARLDLQPHPEGGWFRRIYTASGEIATSGGSRPLATSIYYLLAGAQRSGKLHRNRSDILHFLIDGGPVDYFTLAPDGELSATTLGPSLRHLCVPGGHWKASRLAEDAGHALVAEVVVPGFDFADHEYASEGGVRRLAPGLVETLRCFLSGQ